MLSVNFSPDGRQLCSGSGDSTVRFWDLNSQLPLRSGEAHKTWVMVVAWSCDALQVASGDKSGLVHVWDAKTGTSRGPCTGHKKWITSIAWEPAHLCLPCKRFVTSSKDKTLTVWNADTRRSVMSMSSHTNTINCVKWTGEGYILSASSDATINVWNSTDGRIIRVLKGHAHWINSLALSTEHTLRTGAFDHTGTAPSNPEEALVVLLSFCFISIPGYVSVQAIEHFVGIKCT